MDIRDVDPARLAPRGADGRVRDLWRLLRGAPRSRPRSRSGADRRRLALPHPLPDRGRDRRVAAPARRARPPGLEPHRPRARLDGVRRALLPARGSRRVPVARGCGVARVLPAALRRDRAAAAEARAVRHRHALARRADGLRRRRGARLGRAGRGRDPRRRGLAERDRDQHRLPVRRRPPALGRRRDRLARRLAARAPLAAPRARPPGDGDPRRRLPVRGRHVSAGRRDRRAVAALVPPHRRRRVDQRAGRARARRPGPPAPRRSAPLRRDRDRRARRRPLRAGQRRRGRPGRARARPRARAARC